MKKGLCAAAKHNDSILLYMDLITYLQWIMIRQRKQELVMHSQLLQTDIRTVEAQWGKKALKTKTD